MEPQSQRDLIPVLWALQPSRGYRLPVSRSGYDGKLREHQPMSALGEGILHTEGVDLMPSNIQLSGMEVSW